MNAAIPPVANVMIASGEPTDLAENGTAADNAVIGSGGYNRLKPKVRIAKGSRVQERAEPGRIGTVIGAVGKGKWEVQFDGEGAIEVKASRGALTLYERATGKKESHNKPATSVQAAAPKTGRKGRGSSRSTHPSSDDDVDDNDDEEDFDEDYDEESSYDGSSSSSALRKPTPPRKKKLRVLASSAKKIVSLPRRRKNMGRKQLFTPRSKSPSREDSLDSSNVFGSNSFDSDVYIPEEDDGFDDGFEKEEDDKCQGEPKLITDNQGGTRTEYLDEPQKNEKYQAAKKMMDGQKEKLIEEKHKIVVEVKSKKAYVFGGRVEGRASTEFAECLGTITEVIDKNRYRIQWDDGTDTEALKNQLRLSKEPNQKVTWEVVRDHIAPNPPSAYSQVGVVGFRAEEFAIMDTESEDYSHPFFKLLLSLWPGD
ncbi:hypothetical protein THAOC_32261, partial [Thalassiosira oceanica]